MTYTIEARKNINSKVQSVKTFRVIGVRDRNEALESLYASLPPGYNTYADDYEFVKVEEDQ